MSKFSNYSEANIIETTPRRGISGACWYVSGAIHRRPDRCKYYGKRSRHSSAPGIRPSGLCRRRLDCNRLDRTFGRCFIQCQGADIPGKQRRWGCYRDAYRPVRRCKRWQPVVSRSADGIQNAASGRRYQLCDRLDHRHCGVIHAAGTARRLTGRRSTARLEVTWWQRLPLWWRSRPLMPVLVSLVM